LELRLTDAETGFPCCTISTVFQSTVEPHFTPTEIASRSGMTKRTVLADIHAGRFNGEYFKRAGNQIRVSASGVNAWRRSFRVQVEHPNDTHSK